MLIKPRNSKGYYTIDSDLFISVTTALQVVYKRQLDLWKQRNVAQTALDATKGTSVNQVLTDANGIKNSAGSVGRRTHKIIELAKDVVDVSTQAEDIKPYLESYNKFLKSMRFGVIAKEITCYSKDYRYAGTADLIIRTFYGEVWLCDYKTSNYIHDINQLQLSAYKHAVEEMGIAKIDRLFIIHLTKTSELELVEAVDDFESFKAVLKLCKWEDKDNIKFKLKNENEYSKKE